MTFKAPFASTGAKSLRLDRPTAAASSSSTIACVETSSPARIKSKTMVSIAPFAKSGLSLNARKVSSVRSSIAAPRAAASGFFIKKAFVFVFGTKAQVAGGGWIPPCHCLGQDHHDVALQSDPPTHRSGVTDLRAPSAAASQRVSPLTRAWLCYLRAGRRRLRRFSRWLADVRTEDFLGVAGLFVLLWMFLLMSGRFD